MGPKWKLGECNSGYSRLLRASFTYLFGLKKAVQKHLKATSTFFLIYPYCCSEFKMLLIKTHLIYACVYAHAFLWLVNSYTLNITTLYVIVNVRIYGSKPTESKGVSPRTMLVYIAINPRHLCINYYISHLIGADCGTCHESSIATATVNKEARNKSEELRSLTHPGLELHGLLVLGYLIRLVSTIISGIWLSPRRVSSLDNTDQKVVSTNNSIVATLATSSRIRSSDRSIADSLLLSVN